MDATPSDWAVEEAGVETVAHRAEDVIFVRFVQTHTSRVLGLIEGGRGFAAHKEASAVVYAAVRRARQLGIDPKEAA